MMLLEKAQLLNDLLLVLNIYLYNIHLTVQARYAHSSGRNVENCGEGHVARDRHLGRAGLEGHRAASGVWIT